MRGPARRDLRFITRERSLLGELAGRLQSMSDREVTEAIASGTRNGLTVRTGVRAGIWESE